MSALRMDGRASFYAIQGLYPGEAEGGRPYPWKLGYGQDTMAAVDPVKHGYDKANSYGPSGDCWQITGQYGTFDLSFAFALLRLIREHEDYLIMHGKVSRKTPIEYRVVHIEIEQCTVVMKERDLPSTGFKEPETLYQIGYGDGDRSDRWRDSVYNVETQEKLEALRALYEEGR